jgi:HlyD family secretion protein
VHIGQKAVFTVDAFAGREFHGNVLQIRKSPKIVQYVVTYTVLVSADNSDLSLLPGMTANIQIILDERRNALKVPSAALRFKLQDEEAKIAGSASRASSSSTEPAQSRVYVIGERGKPQPVDLVLGISDGIFTEVVSGPLTFGQQVIVGLNATSSKNSGRPAKRFAF